MNNLYVTDHSINKGRQTMQLQLADKISISNSVYFASITALLEQSWKCEKLCTFNNKELGNENSRW